SNFSPEEKDRYNANIRATNILLQGLPKDIYTLRNHYTDAKEIWDNVKMLLEGSELTKKDQESQLVDKIEVRGPIHGVEVQLADDCDAFDSDVDEAPTTQTMFMANLSSADPVYDEARPSYGSDILSEYVKDHGVPGVHSNVSSVPNDAYMMIYNDMYESHAQSLMEHSS
nr:integrase, catalytic region, zinc finger, CCHC-type, peptidase aspartic, catalytic [Tanacetum cinerariifolium]